MNQAEFSKGRSIKGLTRNTAVRPKQQSSASDGQMQGLNAHLQQGQTVKTMVKKYGGTVTNQLVTKGGAAALFFLMFAVCGLFADDKKSTTETLACITSISGISTNDTKQVGKELPIGTAPVRIWLTAKGEGSTGDLTVVCELTGDGTIYESAKHSLIKLTLPATGGETETISKWFGVIAGYKIRVGRVISTNPSGFSDIQVTLGRARD